MENEITINNTDYTQWLSNLKKAIKNAQIKAAVKVNEELLRLYWSLGKDIVEMQKSSHWGDSFLQKLSNDLSNEFIDMKGFSYRNLKSIRQWYLFYNQSKAIGKQLVSPIQNTLPAIQSDLATQTIKDPYNFDFLTLTQSFNEKELENALIENVTKFLVELGKGFAYVGRQIHFEVGGESFMPDLLFYHLELRCFVVIELKVTDFEPSYLGQLNFYVNMINHQMKKDIDAPTIGLLICKNKNDVVAQYALEGYEHPLGISQFELNNLIPDKFKSALPTIEEIEIELSKL